MKLEAGKRFFIPAVLLAWIAPAAYFAPAALFAPPAGKGDEADVRDWSRIVVLEAFISRQTYLDYRDAHSAPEFGWHVKQGETFAGGGVLYSTIFVPHAPEVPLRMALVERDVFADDLVATFDLKAGSQRYRITGQGDYAVVERTRFRPDSQSGGDARPPGGELTAGKDWNDTVSFLEGDYTDYRRLPAERGLLFFSGRCRLDLPGATVRRVPEGNAIAGRFLVEYAGGRSLRVRGRIGAGRCPFTVFQTAADPAGRRAIRGRYLRAIESSESGRDFEVFARSMEKFDREGTFAACRRSPGSAGEGIACAFYLYKYGTADDRARLNRGFEAQSERYRRLVGRAKR